VVPVGAIGTKIRLNGEENHATIRSPTKSERPKALTARIKFIGWGVLFSGVSTGNRTRVSAVPPGRSTTELYPPPGARSPQGAGVLHSSGRSNATAR
jgi:hypothetical protein